MESGAFVGKQIHLDEHACSEHLDFARPFPHGVLRAHLLELRACSMHSRGEGKTSWHPVFPLLFVWWRKKDVHAVYYSFSEWKVNN